MATKSKGVTKKHKRSKLYLKKLLDDYGMEPDELELIAAPEYYERIWTITDSPFTKALDYLEDLDLFGGSDPYGLKMDDLEFFREWNSPLKVLRPLG